MCVCMVGEVFVPTNPPLRRLCRFHRTIFVSSSRAPRRPLPPPPVRGPVLCTFSFLILPTPSRLAATSAITNPFSATHRPAPSRPVTPPPVFDPPDHLSLAHSPPLTPFPILTTMTADQPRVSITSSSMHVYIYIYRVHFYREQCTL